MIHQYADQVVLEWGNSGQDLASANSNSELSVNADGSPKAQGGFLKKSGNYIYGIYLGNESNTSSQLRALSSSQAAIIEGIAANSCNSNAANLLDGSDNQIDLFFGWGSNIKYGANFLYTKSDDDTNNSEDEAMAVRFGVDAGKWDAHLNLSLKSQAKETVNLTALNNVNAAMQDSVEHEFDGSLGLHVGGSYEVAENARVWAYYKTFKWDQKDNFDYAGVSGTILDGVNSGSQSRGKQGTSEGEFTTIQLGYGKTMKAGNGTVFASAFLEHKTIELKGAATIEVENVIVPVTFGYEAKATEWLTLRGSVVHNIYGERDNKNFSNLNSVALSLAQTAYGNEGEGSLENSTNVNAGATLTFGKLNIDGFIGTTAFSRTGSAGEQGVLSTDNLMTRVAMTYNF